MMSGDNTKVISADGTQRRATRVANWAAELTAEHDPKYREFLKRAGMTVVVLADDNWTATSPHAPWSNQ